MAGHRSLKRGTSRTLSEQKHMSVRVVCRMQVLCYRSICTASRHQAPSGDPTSRRMEQDNKARQQRVKKWAFWGRMETCRDSLSGPCSAKIVKQTSCLALLLGPKATTSIGYATATSSNSDVRGWRIYLEIQLIKTRQCHARPRCYCRNNAR